MPSRDQIERFASAGIIAAVLVILALVRQHFRREHDAYDALYQAGLWAMNQMARRYPPTAFSTPDPERNQWVLAARCAYYEERKRAAREAVAEDFGLTIQELEAIERKG